jgi:hypothetical protein
MILILNSEKIVYSNVKSNHSHPTPLGVVGSITPQARDGSIYDAEENQA